MDRKIAGICAVVLLLGAILNYVWAIFAKSMGIPVSIEFVIVAYCLLVLMVPLRLPEVLGIGILSGFLTFLANPLHTISISGGQISLASGLSMALFNLVSEPVGILVCFVLVGLFVTEVPRAAAFPATMMATLASGFTYLILVTVLNSSLLDLQPDYLIMFFGKVIQVAVVNGIIVQVLFLAVGEPVTKYLRIAAD